MKKIKKGILFLFCFLVLAFLGVIVSFYWIAMNTELPGRRGGPQDAFRHTYATAVISRYVSPSVVDVITEICETNDDSIYDQMDRHNNHVGKHLGLTDLPIYETVQTLIRFGDMNSKEKDQVTWLPEEKWTNGF